MGFEVWGLRFEVWGLRFGVWGLEFMCWVCGLLGRVWIKDLGLRVKGLRFRISASTSAFETAGVEDGVETAGVPPAPPIVYIWLS